MNDSTDSLATAKVTCPRIVIPIQLEISVQVSPTRPPMAGMMAGAAESAAEAITEALRQPIINTDYSDRTGFNTQALGIETPLPEVTDPNLVSQMLDGSGHVIPYEHFSVVMHRERRLALYTASTVDYSPQAKFPEPGEDYTRKGLTGLGKNDREKWLVDSRIPESEQLDDTFYNNDRGAFDKGHVVRREDVCWGDSYEQVRQANGDTFHSTNCTPQRANFNQAGEDGLWGKLEDFIKAQADTEILNVLAGPVLADSDRIFNGKDRMGAVRIQIPRKFWKIVCANKDGNLQVYAFLLEQTTEDVTVTEFAVNAQWKRRMIGMPELQELLPQLKFAEVYFEADQAPGRHELAPAQVNGLLTQGDS